MLVVISPESFVANEAATIEALFDAGLDYYHLRKTEESYPYDQLLKELSSSFRKKIRVHGRYQDLQERWGVLEHSKDGEHIHPKENSRSIHSLSQAVELEAAYFLFAPVFSSISKPDHKPAKGLEDLKPLLQTLKEQGKKVLALGGVNFDNAADCMQAGFSGVALKGSFWLQEEKNRLDYFKKVWSIVHKHTY